jgi:mono/diheme cytochrome c family protein
MNGSMGGATNAAPVAMAESASTAAPAPAGAYQYVAGKGESLFTANCSACHQATGEGIPGAFPPLKGNAASPVLDAGATGEVTA